MHGKRVGVLLTVLVTLGPVGCGAPAADPETSVPLASGSSIVRSIPPDVAAAGLRATPVTVEGTISAEAALGIHSRETRESYAGGSVDAFLVSLTDVSTLRSDRPVRDRVVWLIRYADLSIPYSGPLTADGTPAEGGTITHAYVVVDAFTGELLYTMETA
ncbi:MAG TPA: hypothetical protein VE569_00350 [Acidimicrobiia bacterium]|nr:hypothetical protein [Acidimicrobiia bacterium]